MKKLRNVASRLLPLGSQRRSFVRKILKPTQPKSPQVLTYEQWIARCEPILFHATPQRLSAVAQAQHPLISIVVPCYNTPRKYLLPLIESVAAQLYDNWELILVDGSTKQSSNRLIEQQAQNDKRIAYIKVGKNLGIVGNTNIGIAQAKGSFVAFMDHDDTLSPYALAEIALVLNQNPKVDLIYSDEDKLSDDGKRRLLPFFKPDWSPELLLGVNYITHFVVARKSLVEDIGGLRKGFDGAQDYDFLLRITEKTERIAHIPKILYHWRLAEGSTAKQVTEKNYADTAGRQALRDAAKRRAVKAEVLEIADRPTNYRLKYSLSTKPKVSIIIPFKDKPDLLKQCTDSIFDVTTYKNYELILVSNNSTETETEKLLTGLKKHPKCRVYYWNHAFNYSKINNYGVSKAKGEYIVLLNNDTKLITPEWLEELVGVASQPGIGAVGPVLYYPKKSHGIQHAGVIVGMGTMAGHAFRHHQLNDWTEFGMPAWPRNYLAVTGACLVISKKLYKRMGGLDETFTVAGQDVALGIKLYESGYRNVYWPFAALYHYESVSVGTYNNGIKLDYDHSLTYYKKYHRDGDPYFNPNLDLMNEQIGLRSIYDN